MLGSKKASRRPNASPFPAPDRFAANDLRYQGVLVGTFQTYAGLRAVRAAQTAVFCVGVSVFNDEER